MTQANSHTFWPRNNTCHTQPHPNKGGQKVQFFQVPRTGEKWKHLANSTTDDHMMELMLRNIGYCLKSHRQ